MSPIVIGIVVVVLAGIIAATVKAPRLTSVILWSLVATIFFTAALLLTAPGPFSEKALWITIANPFIWVGFQFWCYWDSNKWRVAGGLILLSVLSSIVVFATDPVI